MDPKVFVKAQVASYEHYRPDIIVMERDLLMDAEAMGNELKFPEDSMCISTKVALEDKGKLGRLQPADPTKDGRIPDYLESLAETKKIITDAIVSAVIAGAWTIAIGLRDAGRLLRDAMKDPDLSMSSWRYAPRSPSGLVKRCTPSQLFRGTGFMQPYLS
jgi:uroporphyrinogen decarboxylase